MRRLRVWILRRLSNEAWWLARPHIMWLQRTGGDWLHKRHHRRELNTWQRWWMYWAVGFKLKADRLQERGNEENP